MFASKTYVVQVSSPPTKDTNSLLSYARMELPPRLPVSDPSSIFLRVSMSPVLGRWYMNHLLGMKSGAELRVNVFPMSDGTFSRFELAHNRQSTGCATHG